MVKMKMETNVLKKFDSMLDLTRNFRPVFKKVLGAGGPNSEPWTIQGGLHLSFSKETSPNGAKFKALSPKYKARKDRDYSPDLPILMRTGYLYETLVYGNTSNSVLTMTNTKMIYGTDLKYAAVHQFGSPKKNIPKRPYIGFRKNQSERIQLEIRKYLMEAYNRKFALGLM